MTEGNGLRDIAEQVRAESFPDVDRQLVNDLLTTHIELQDDRAGARKRTEQIINRWSAQQAAPGDASVGEKS